MKILIIISVMRYDINSFEDFNEGNLGFFGYR